MMKKGKIGTVVIDYAAYYLSDEFEDWCKENNIRHRTNAPYRHQSMGIVERYSKNLMTSFKKVAHYEGGT